MVLTALSVISVDASREHKELHVPAIFVFGDSLADAGTNTFIPQVTVRADFPPYGKTFFWKPTGRFTNGRTIVDFISQKLELQFAPPFLQPHASFIKGVNFASGGSGLLESTSEVRHVVSMSAQVQLGATQDQCSRPYKSLFWDWAHPTEHVVSILADLLITGNTTLAYPINLKALAAL